MGKRLLWAVPFAMLLGVCCGCRSTEHIAMTYNIRHGRGMDDKVDLERIAEVIRQCGPEVVTLNEVDCGRKRSGNVDQTAKLAELLGWHGIFGASLLEGGGYGNAVLSRYPLEKVALLKLPYDGLEERTALVVKVLAPKPYYVVSTHFAYLEKVEPLRIRSVEMIAENVKKNNWLPVIVAGDLNTDLRSPVIGRLRELGFQIANDLKPDALSHPSDVPEWMLDYIAFLPADAVRIDGFEVIENKIASDHRPVRTLFRWK